MTMLWQACRTGFAENYKPPTADNIAQAVAAFVLLVALWIAA
jgi:hypothetical protein